MSLQQANPPTNRATVILYRFILTEIMTKTWNLGQIYSAKVNAQKHIKQLQVQLDILPSGRWPNYNVLAQNQKIKLANILTELCFFLG